MLDRSDSIPMPLTMFDRLVDRTKLPETLVAGGLAVIFLLLAGIAFAQDRFLQHGFGGDAFRTMLLAPTITVLIAAIQGFSRANRVRVFEEFRLLMRMNPEDFGLLLNNLSPLRRWGEWLALGCGMAIGLLIPWDAEIPGQFLWTRRYTFALGVLMAGIAVWLIYISFAITRLIHQLHRQPLKINLFSLGFLAPIARRSLIIAIIFVGIMTLSVLLLPVRMLDSMYSLASYSFFTLFILITFFLSLGSTHQLLIATKKRELEMLRHCLLDAYHALRENQNADANSISAWLAYEKRIEQVPEWPFNVNTIRDLSVSVLVPGITFAVRFLMAR